MKKPVPRKPVLLAFLFLLALVSSRLWRELPAKAAGGGGGSEVNGDVNGDGGRDISDAVYLLNWLFSGGPEPVALAVSGDLEPRVAALEAIVHGCFRLEDRNQDGVPDCGQDIPDGTPCDDGNPCTDASFFIGGECRGVAGPDGRTCDDGDPQTSGDRCEGGVCRGQPVAMCGDGRCDPTESPASCPEDCGECFPGETRDCSTGLPGPCGQGIQMCLGGQWSPCEPQAQPTQEVCDHQDNDCDGAIDEGIDLGSDPQNCGDCGIACPAGMRCLGGTCVQ